LPGPNY